MNRMSLFMHAFHFAGMPGITMFAFLILLNSKI
jgi:hypothetical protein